MSRIGTMYKNRNAHSTEGLPGALRTEREVAREYVNRTNPVLAGSGVDGQGKSRWRRPSPVFPMCETGSRDE
jgi:hypothetical protein